MIHTDTYIEKEEANAIKALALLLVIWGHNHYLTPLQSTFGYWIYAFHVITFFILPNFYLPKEETFSVFLKKLTTSIGNISEYRQNNKKLCIGLELISGNLWVKPLISLPDIFNHHLEKHIRVLCNLGWRINWKKK